MLDPLRLIKTLCVALGVNFLTAASGDALALDEPADKQESQAAASESPLSKRSDAIVVTARKREEDVQDVPLAITVVPPDRLEDKAATDLSQLQNEVPNLVISQGRNQSTTLSVFLRGIGQADPLWGVDSGVGVYLDDVYLSRAQGALLDLFDVERIEVLRGPQGTLYGKNTIGGAIRYVSKPLQEDFSGAVSISAGTDSHLDLRASVGGALVPGKVRGRIALASLRHEGHGVNRFTGRDVSDRDTFAARGALSWTLGTNTIFELGGNFTDDRAQPKGYQRLEANPYCSAFLGEGCPPLNDRFDTESGLEPRNGTTSSGGSLVLTTSLGAWWRLKSITAYRESESENNIDFDTTPARIVDVIGMLHDHQWSQELQVTFDSPGRLVGILGLYYFSGEAGGRARNIFLDQSFTQSSGRTLTDSIALFGDGSYRLTPRLNAHFGVRAMREHKNGIAFNAAFTGREFDTISAVTADYDRKATFDSIAPRFGVDYRFSEDVLGYVSFSRGFRSGGFNIRALETAFPESAGPFEDETLDMGEAGLKSMLRNGTVLLNIALFAGDYQDVQVSTFTAYDSNGDGAEDAFFGNFLNAGDATILGAEVEFDASLPSIDWLSVNGFAAWLDARPDQFLDRNTDGFVDTQLIMNAPELTGALRLQVHAPFRGGVITSSIGASYRGEAIVTNEGGSYPGRPGEPLLPISQGAYWLTEAWVSWLSSDARWRFGVVGRNLGDTGYLTSGYNVPAFGVLTGAYGEPRTVLATVEYRIR